MQRENTVVVHSIFNVMHCENIVLVNRVCSHSRLKGPLAINSFQSLMGNISDLLYFNIE